MLRRLATPMIALAASVSLAGCNLLPEGRASTAPTTRTTVVAAAGPKARQCLAELGGTGARFAPQPDKYYGAGCSTLNSVTVERLRGDADGFELANMGPVTCPAANALAGWARYGVDRAARQILGSRLEVAANQMQQSAQQMRTEEAGVQCDRAIEAGECCGRTLQPGCSNRLQFVEQRFARLPSQRGVGCCQSLCIPIRLQCVESAVVVRIGR